MMRKSWGRTSTNLLELTRSLVHNELDRSSLLSLRLESDSESKSTDPTSNESDTKRFSGGHRCESKSSFAFFAEGQACPTFAFPSFVLLRILRF